MKKKDIKKLTKEESFKKLEKLKKDFYEWSVQIPEFCKDVKSC